VAGQDGGIAIVDLANPAAPAPIAVKDTPGLAYGVAVSGATVAVADRGLGVTFVDPATGADRGHQLCGDAWGVAISGSDLYVAASVGLTVMRNAVAAAGSSGSVSGAATPLASTVAGGRATADRSHLCRTPGKAKTRRYSMFSVAVSPRQGSGRQVSSLDVRRDEGRVGTWRPRRPVAGVTSEAAWRRSSVPPEGMWRARRSAGDLPD
jgi:hypothetical protein